MIDSKDYPILFAEKLEFFKSLLSSQAFQPLSPKKPEVSTFFDAQNSAFFIRSEKTLNFPQKKVVDFLFSAYQHHFLIDERQGKTFFLKGIIPDLHFLYYFLKSPKEELIENQDMFLLNGIFFENPKEAYVIGFSIEFENEKSKQKGVLQMKSLINGYRIKETSEKSCEIVHIISRNYKNRLPNFVNYDWNQGGHIEKIERTLLFLSPQEISNEKERGMLELEGIIDTLLKEKSEKDSWIEKYEEMLKPSPEDFTNVEKLDLFNLFGEPYKPKIGKGRKNMADNRMELPKSMAVKVKNNRTKEYFANLMTKNKK